MVASKLIARLRALPGGVFAMGGTAAATLLACNAVLGLNEFDKADAVDAGRADVTPPIDAPIDSPVLPDAGTDGDPPIIELPDGALSPTLVRWQMSGATLTLGTIGGTDGGADAGADSAAPLQVVQQTVKTGVAETRVLTWARDESTARVSSFDEAKQACSKLGGAFRLPSRIELLTLIDLSKNTPGENRIAALFGGTNNGEYWTASPRRPLTEPAQFWTVRFGSDADPVLGGARETGDTDGAWVRCVSSNVDPKPGAAQFGEFLRTSNLIYDRFSRLIWERKAVAVANQAAAVAYCTNSHVIDGLGSWRMPKLRELLTTVSEQPVRVYVNGQEENRFIDLSAFPATQAGPFWSDDKITSGASMGSSFAVTYENGESAALGSGVGGFVRCVQDY
jgi:hypothetical protein